MSIEMGEVTNGTYFKQWWQEMPPAPKKRWHIFLAGFGLFWLAGAVYAPTAVVGISRLTGLARLLTSLAMGGFSFLWRLLKGLDLIQETVAAPNIIWMILALTLPALIGGFIYLLIQPPNPLFNMQKMLSRFARSQGRLEAAEVARQLAIRHGVPYALVDKEQGAKKGKKPIKVGLDYAGGEGHLLVSGPTRSGKVRRVTAQ
jgi:hypothetical protein